MINQCAEGPFRNTGFYIFKWAHYDEETDGLFCFTCLKAAETISMSFLALSQGDALTKRGYSNWKSAMDKTKVFRSHQYTNSHKEAADRTINTSLTSCNIIDLPSTRMTLERKTNREMLLTILSNVRYLARQSLAFRGNWNEKAGAESESNSHQLLMLRSLDNSSIADWLKRKSGKFTSPTIQHDILA